MCSSPNKELLTTPIRNVRQNNEQAPKISFGILMEYFKICVTLEKVNSINPITLIDAEPPELNINISVPIANE